ncbi:uncharacterized protein LOC111051552 [Nilaparvata lugens]|uniref:uncharacterized protein LOC111051552 n=1 Tax=Nilaparvata lugens TaxID=108931 RepID=UPI00193C9C13|nr:uncharacterized protein LOC111051552 [Nilaparvata lugens]
MPYTCCVPCCRGNYDAEHKVAVFSFPKDENLKRLWIRSIPRKDYSYTSSSRVCEKHFSIDEIQRFTSAYDEKTGKIVTAPLKFPRLKPDAVPTIFPGCPKYMSSTTHHREAPTSKKKRFEEEQVSKAIELSKSSLKNYNDERSFQTFSELCLLYKKFKFNSCWTIVSNNDSLSFILLRRYEGIMTLDYSIEIDQELNMNVFYRGVALSKLRSGRFPQKVENINFIIDVLDEVENLFKNRCSSVNRSYLINLIIDSLIKLRNNVDEGKKCVVDFVKEQIGLINCQPENYRYGTEILIFSTMLHLVSPQGYKFLRESGNIILPHPVTLKKINSSLKLNPMNELDDTSFLSYLRRKNNILGEQDRNVILMIDEVHIKQNLDYKGGNIVGMDHENVDLANSAFVFMIKSIASKFKDVAHILPVKKITADVLHSITRRTIVSLEMIGFRVLMVVTDNNSINRKAMRMFNNPLADTGSTRT